ncbi:MAG: universal stress protein [Acidimicrobiales bacterium]
MKSRIDKRILVPIDGSDFSRAALSPAAEIVAGGDGELVMLLVITDGFEQMVERFMSIEHVTPEGTAGAHLDRIEQDLDDELHDLEISHVIRTSADPADEILQVAGEIGATMIALTSHGYTGLKKLFMGSVSEAVLRGSSIPVLLVPSETDTTR